MTVTCPTCGGVIPTADLNVSTDLAACRACDALHRLSELTSTRSPPPIVAPPPGAWIDTFPDGFRAGATTRSPQAFFLVPFVLVWAGGSLGGIYGGQVSRGHFDPFLSLFGIPFLIGAFVFGAAALMTVAGRVELTVRGDDAEAFVGLGRLGWRRRFPWSGIHSVAESPVTMRYPGGGAAQLVLEGTTRITVASGVSEARRYFLLNVLRRHLKRAR